MSESMPDPLGPDPLITETIDRFFSEHCPPTVVQAAEEVGHARELWKAFNDLGFARISVPEEAGGAGGTLLDALEVLRLVGYYAAPLPVADNSIMGGWLLSQAGLPIPNGALAVPELSAYGVEIFLHSNWGKDDPEVALDGSLIRVPWANDASHIVFLEAQLPEEDDPDEDETELDQEPPLVVSIDLSEVGPFQHEVMWMRNIAGERRDTVNFTEIKATAAFAPPGVNKETLNLRGALSRSMLMAGALKRMVELTVSYTNEREQFGRPISRFQAVQQHLVWAAQEAAMTEINAQLAGRAVQAAEDAGGTIADCVFEVASAKLIANQAAIRATKACHQAHGAMGMTQEYPLHHLSRRLWTWRMDYGAEPTWTDKLGEIIATQEPTDIYPLITSGKAQS